MNPTLRAKTPSVGRVPLLHSAVTLKAHAGATEAREVKLKPAILLGLLKDVDAPRVRGPVVGYSTAHPCPSGRPRWAGPGCPGLGESQALAGEATQPVSSSALCLSHALPFRRTWACVPVGTARDRRWPETSGRSGSPTSSAAAGAPCSPASQPGEGGDTGGSTEKAALHQSSRGGGTGVWEGAEGGGRRRSPWAASAPSSVHVSCHQNCAEWSWAS